MKFGRIFMQAIHLLAVLVDIGRLPGTVGTRW